MSRIKKLEQEIQELKDLILQLQSQVIALQARGVITITPQVPMPVVVPAIPTIPPSWPPYEPYVGDVPPGLGNPTITWGTTISGNNTQVSRCVK